MARRRRPDWRGAQTKKHKTVDDKRLRIRMLLPHIGGRCTRACAPCEHVSIYVCDNVLVSNTHRYKGKPKYVESIIKVGGNDQRICMIKTHSSRRHMDCSSSCDCICICGVMVTSAVSAYSVSHNRSSSRQGLCICSDRCEMYMLKK